MISKSEYMDSPRHLFKDTEFDKDSTKKKRRLMIGSKSNGVYIDITKEGLYLNGYYKGFREDDTRYTNLREPMFISWEDIEKEKNKLTKTHKNPLVPDREEIVVDSEYLKKLPLVTINGIKYYIDAECRERRTERNPRQVFKW